MRPQCRFSCALLALYGLLLVGCSSAPDEHVVTEAGQEPTGGQGSASENVIPLEPADVERVDSVMTLPSGQGTLEPPGRTQQVRADFALIEERLAEIPEQLSGIKPRVLLGNLVTVGGGVERAGSETIPALVIVFDNVPSRPLATPAGFEAPEGDSPAMVVAVYDAETAAEIGVWVFGCGTTGACSALDQ